MAKFNNYENLKVWHNAIMLAKEIYLATRDFPKEEIYGLTSQIRRSAVSIASNIAEGSRRIGKKEFQQFIGIAAGSAAELKTQIIISREVGYINSGTADTIMDDIDSIERMLTALSKSLDSIPATRDPLLAT